MVRGKKLWPDGRAAAYNNDRRATSYRVCTMFANAPAITLVRNTVANSGAKTVLLLGSVPFTVQEYAPRNPRDFFFSNLYFIF